MRTFGGGGTLLAEIVLVSSATVAFVFRIRELVIALNPIVTIFLADSTKNDVINSEKRRNDVINSKKAENDVINSEKVSPCFGVALTVAFLVFLDSDTVGRSVMHLYARHVGQ